MTKPKVQILLTDRGDYEWVLLDEHGKVVPIGPGSVPGLRNFKGRSELRKAVQAGLKSLYEHQQAATG